MDEELPVAVEEMKEAPVAPAAEPQRRLLTRDEILRADDIATEEVDVPEWGGRVLVRALTGTQRDRFEDESTIQKRGRARLNYNNLRARLVARCVVDEEGKRVFSDRDVDELGRKSAGALDRVYAVAARLSGLRDEDLDELLGNSESGPSDSSTTD